MHTSKNQKSSWFLTIVAFVMVLFWVGYIFSCLSWSETFAVNNNENISPYAENIHIKDLQWKEDQEKTNAGFERSVAERAISWWNKLVGNNDSTSSLTVNLPGNDDNTVLWDKVASWYEDTSTTNVAWDNMQLSFANSYILPSVYQDISTSSYQDAITILYSNGIIQSSNKFYPHNYVRVSDFIRVVMDAYRVQLWYEPSSLVGLTTNFYFSDSSFDSEVMKRVNSAYELWFLQSFALNDAEWKLRLDAFITPQEAKDILWEIKNKSDSIKNIPNLSWQSKETLRKDEMAELVVSAFGLKLNEWSLAVFSDISWSPYQSDIQLLAKLGIVWWVDGKFYPDAKIENKDFVVMIARALMRQSDSQPTISNFYYLTNLLNASYNSTYSPYLEFCLESQICNSLLSQTSNWVSFVPDRTLSWWEVTSILPTVYKSPLIVAWDKQQLITRWEVAKLIVDAFWFNDEKSWSSILSMSNWWIQNYDSSNKNALSSLWTDFQNMMKIS